MSANKFRVEKEEYQNRTFKMPKNLLERLYVIVNEKGISLNKLVIKCINYALDNMEEDESNE